MSQETPVTVAYGDGIGPEIMEASLHMAARIAGSVGLAGSVNVGATSSMFEASHGSAPRRAGQNLANPSGLLPGGVMMPVHIGQWEIAERLHNAWVETLEEGIHTYDIYAEGVSTKKVGTKELAQAVVAGLGQKPEKLKAASYSHAVPKRREWKRDDMPAPSRMELAGVDLCLDSRHVDPKSFETSSATLHTKGWNCR